MGATEVAPLQNNDFFNGDFSASSNDNFSASSEAVLLCKSLFQCSKTALLIMKIVTRPKAKALGYQPRPFHGNYFQRSGGKGGCRYVNSAGQ